MPFTLLSYSPFILDHCSTMAAISIALACAALFLLTLIRHTFRRKGSNNLRGPASASVLLGQWTLSSPIHTYPSLTDVVLR